MCGGANDDNNKNKYENNKVFRYFNMSKTVRIFSVK